MKIAWHEAKRNAGIRRGIYFGARKSAYRIKKIGHIALLLRRFQNLSNRRRQLAPGVFFCLNLFLPLRVSS